MTNAISRLPNWCYKLKQAKLLVLDFDDTVNVLHQFLVGVPEILEDNREYYAQCYVEQKGKSIVQNFNFSTLYELSDMNDMIWVIWLIDPSLEADSLKATWVKKYLDLARIIKV